MQVYFYDDLAGDHPKLLFSLSYSSSRPILTLAFVSCFFFFLLTVVNPFREKAKEKRDWKKSDGGWDEKPRSGSGSASRFYFQNSFCSCHSIDDYRLYRQSIWQETCFFWGTRSLSKTQKKTFSSSWKRTSCFTSPSTFRPSHLAIPSNFPSPFCSCGFLTLSATICFYAGLWPTR